MPESSRRCYNEAQGLVRAAARARRPMDSPGRSMEAAELDESAVTAASRSYELANGPVFTPLATPAHRASHAILSSSRLPPRTFPGFEGFDAPPKHDSGRAAPFHPAGGGGSSGSSSRGGSLEEKLRRDHDFASSQREAEARIRFELERSKESLIEGYQRGEERLAAELLHCKEGCDALLREKDDQLARMEARLVEGREGAKVEAEANRRRVQEREQALLVQVKEAEGAWKVRLAEAEEVGRAALRSAEASFALQGANRDLTERARGEAREEICKVAYEKKIARYESQVREAVQHYRDKELQMQGGLEEARREILHIKNTADAREDALREELSLKDRRLVTVQARLFAVDEMSRVADSWRTASKELASMVVRVCVSVRDLPPAPIPDNALMSDIFQGYAREAELSSLRVQYQSQLKNYQALRREHVGVQKHLLDQCLRNSKRVIERVRAEIVPAFDCDLDD